MSAKGVPVKSRGSRAWTQADCIICGGDAKKYGRATGVRYGDRYICGQCFDRGLSFNRAGEIVEATPKPKPAVDLQPFYDALVYKVLAYADEEIVTRERDKTYEWIRKLPNGETLIENWIGQKS